MALLTARHDQTGRLRPPVSQWVYYIQMARPRVSAAKLHSLTWAERNVQPRDRPSYSTIIEIRIHFMTSYAYNTVAIEGI